MEERLQKILSSRLGISRRAAEKLIADGRVELNGSTAVLGDSADPETAEITVDGAETVHEEDEKVYIMLNKPVGYVTTMSDEKGRRTVRDLVSGVGTRVYPVGRLDLNSEGLLIMTNDGELANRLMHPSFEKEKTYKVWARGDGEQGLRRLSEPMELDGFLLRRPRIRPLEVNETGAVFEMTIHEGRNRQVRRMCEIAGMRVTRLVRTREGGLSLGGLKKGEWRFLTEDEVRSLQAK